MTLDYTSHPSELVTGGQINVNVGVQDLRKAIPAHCFKPSYGLSFWYLFRDFLVVGVLMTAAFLYIPKIPLPLLRYAAWAVYGYIQGEQMTGIWVIGHECGHSAFSPSSVLNDMMGFVLHSLLLTPYFSWRSTHRRHHIYANNLAKDHNYVPPQLSTYLSIKGFTAEQLDEMTEDSPIVTFARIVIQQLLGFPWYLLTNITSAQGSLARKKPSKWFLGNSHFLPNSSLFRPEEAHLILLSDIGIGSVLAGMWYASKIVGWHMLALLYVQPYLWVNHWIVAITYLHHTHPKIPKYEPEAWTFLKGATATVDRNLGFAGKHLMHNIADYHVIHHLFSRIPQYHAEEATRAILPLLGASYHVDKDRSFYGGIWESFTKCQYVVPNDERKDPEERTMWYRGGPSPPVEVQMGRGGVTKD
ncbi:hypothetical protein MMC30_004944 [Trapelia coarctata]|nr:hypothetical protein [Trapelia coarctata]